MATLDFFAEIDRITRELYKDNKDDYKAIPLGNYSVWVGGVEMGGYLTYQDAVALRNEYLEDGYDDVEIDTYEEETK
jgi:hypothetical protein